MQWNHLCILRECMFRSIFLTNSLHAYFIKKHKHSIQLLMNVSQMTDSGLLWGYSGVLFVIDFDIHLQLWPQISMCKQKKGVCGVRVYGRQREDSKCRTWQVYKNLNRSNSSQNKIQKKQETHLKLKSRTYCVHNRTNRKHTRKEWWRCDKEHGKTKGLNAQDKKRMGNRWKTQMEEIQLMKHRKQNQTECTWDEGLSE